MAKRSKDTGPSMFDSAGVAGVSRPAVYAAERTPALRAREAWQEETPDRSRWETKGIGLVEVLGSSPVMVWYSIVDDVEQAQVKVTREEFLKKARRQIDTTKKEQQA